MILLVIKSVVTVHKINERTCYKAATDNRRERERLRWRRKRRGRFQNPKIHIAKHHECKPRGSHKENCS